MVRENKRSSMEMEGAHLIHWVGAAENGVVVDEICNETRGLGH